MRFRAASVHVLHVLFLSAVHVVCKGGLFAGPLADGFLELQQACLFGGQVSCLMERCVSALSCCTRRKCHLPEQWCQHHVSACRQLAEFAARSKGVDQKPNSADGPNGGGTFTFPGNLGKQACQKKKKAPMIFRPRLSRCHQFFQLDETAGADLGGSKYSNENFEG